MDPCGIMYSWTELFKTVTFSNSPIKSEILNGCLFVDWLTPTKVISLLYVLIYLHSQWFFYQYFFYQYFFYQYFFYQYFFTILTLDRCLRVEEGDLISVDLWHSEEQHPKEMKSARNHDCHGGNISLFNLSNVFFQSVFFQSVFIQSVLQSLFYFNLNLLC